MIASPSASDALKVPITTPVTFSDAVFELKVKPVGALLALTVILNVSENSVLQIEAFIDPKDIGLVEPGQKVKISLMAYDASKYGYLSGELLQIAPDTIF